MTTAATMRPKTPKALKMQDTLSDGARNRLALHKTKPRTRAPGEATSVVICNAMTGEPYTTGQGEVSQPARAGSEAAYRMPSKGLSV